MLQLHKRLTTCRSKLRLYLRDMTRQPATVETHRDVARVIDACLVEAVLVAVNSTEVVCILATRTKRKGMRNLEDGVQAERLGQVGTSAIKGKVGGLHG